MDIAASLAALADQRDASGKKRFSHEDLVHFTPILILGAGVDYRRYPPLAQLMQKFAAAVGLRTDMAADEAVALVRDYYRRRPPNRHLVRAIRALAREISLEEMSVLAESDLGSIFAAPSGPSMVAGLVPPVSRSAHTGVVRDRGAFK